MVIKSKSEPRGRVISAEVATTYMNWAKSRRKSISGLQDAVNFALLVLSASDEEGCKHRTEEQNSALEQLYSLLLWPLMSLDDGPVLLSAPDVDHMVFVPDEVTQSCYVCKAVPATKTYVTFFLYHFSALTLPYILQVLALVPFAALRFAEKYLIQRFTVTTAPSLALFSSCHSRAVELGNTDRRWLVLCNPEKDVDLQILTQKILPVIKAAAQQKSVAIIPSENEQPTSEAVRQSIPMADRVAIFCHAKLDDITREGELLLARGTLLRASHVKNLQLPMMAKSVLLYACNAGSGRSMAEGLLSLGHAFLLAGSPCVAAPLWEPWISAVVPHSTKVLENLTSGSCVARALQSAAVLLIEQGYSPHYWGCFVCNGYSF